MPSAYSARGYDMRYAEARGAVVISVVIPLPSNVVA